MEIIKRIGRKTLIIVDQTLILEQWIGYFEEWTDASSIGVIQGPKEEVDKDIIIATIQSLNTKPFIFEKLKDEIGFCVVDEAHVIASDTFQNALTKIKPKYSLGLTATPYRDDGLQFMIFAMLGEIYYSSDRQKMIEQGLIIKPELRPVILLKDEFYKEESEDPKKDVWRTVLGNFKADKKIIKIICKIAAHHFNKGDQSLMIIKEEQYALKYFEELQELINFSKEEIANFKKEALIKEEEYKKEVWEKIDKKKWYHFVKEDQKKIAKKSHKEHGIGKWFEYIPKANIIEYEKKLETNKITEFKKRRFKKINWYELDAVKRKNNIVMIMGATSKKERERIIKESKEGVIRIIITTKIFDKAVSVNSLNILFNIFPNKEIANTEQRVGFPFKKAC